MRLDEEGDGLPAASIDDRVDGFVRETTKGGTRRTYAVRDGVIYELLDGKAVRIYGRVVNDIVYKYDSKGRLKEVGRVSREDRKNN